jgi:arylsulfatase A-like enzyme
MEKKPNILIITTDQQRFDAIGAIDPLIYSPHLNQLAKEGALYTHAYTPNPVCVPARQNILTGLTARHHGFDDNDFAHHRFHLINYRNFRRYCRMPVMIPSLSENFILNPIADTTAFIDTYD